jgi:hypothetical protein
MLAIGTSEVDPALISLGRAKEPGFPLDPRSPVLKGAHGGQGRKPPGTKSLVLLCS